MVSKNTFYSKLKHTKDVGKECEGFIRGGKLVPDKLVERVLFKKLSSFKSGWLMDGRWDGGMIKGSWMDERV